MQWSCQPEKKTCFFAVYIYQRFLFFRYRVSQMLFEESICFSSCAKWLFFQHVKDFHFSFCMQKTRSGKWLVMQLPSIHLSVRLSVRPFLRPSIHIMVSHTQVEMVKLCFITIKSNTEVLKT